MRLDTGSKINYVTIRAVESLMSFEQAAEPGYIRTIIGVRSIANDRVLELGVPSEIAVVVGGSSFE